MTDRVRDLAKNPAVRRTVGLAAAAAAGAVAGSRHARKLNGHGHEEHEPVAQAPAAQEPVVEGYCVKERKKVTIKDPVQTTMKNGKPAIRGVCPDCGTKIFRIGSLTSAAR
jgi:hypothetical protein